MNVVVVGVGYVGLITGLSLAKLGNKVTFLDTDKSKIDKLTLGIATFEEPELEDYLNDFDLTVPVSPELAATSSATPLGAIGIALSGAPIFNDTEGTGDVSIGVIQGFDRNGC